jgi:hypothetical protein
LLFRYIIPLAVHKDFDVRDAELFLAKTYNYFHQIRIPLLLWTPHNKFAEKEFFPVMFTALKFSLKVLCQSINGMYSVIEPGGNFLSGFSLKVETPQGKILAVE